MTMRHLTLETLARLVDEAPDTSEAEHLDTCAACRNDLAALRRDRAALGELPDLLPPPADAWPRLEERLRREGLLRAPTRSSRATGLRLAASIVLFLLGGLSGYAFQAWTESDVWTMIRPTRADRPLTASSADPPSAGRTLSTATGTGAAPDVEGAARAVEEAEATYLAALARYAALSASDGEDDARVRLAALEEIVVATREALVAAPADPVINGYHLTALAQREAALREVALASSARWF